MKRSLRLTSLALLSALCLSSCAAISAPPVSLRATDVPGLAMTRHAAQSDDQSAEGFTATLYFRYLDQPMLAAETRELRVQKDESEELALIRALLEGPSAGHVELSRLFPGSVEVESVTAQGDVLFVTLSEALLTDDPVPAEWQADADWTSFAPVYRQLTMQSLVCSVTESFPYTSVQVMVAGAQGRRLENSYFLNGSVGLSDPLMRNEGVLLTPQHTAQCALLAWQMRDFETLYAYTATTSGDENRPLYDRFVEALDGAAALSAFDVSGGSVSANGQRAVVTVSLALSGEGGAVELPAYPLPLVRENGVWKLRYSTLMEMMLR